MEVIEQPLVIARNRRGGSSPFRVLAAAAREFADGSDAMPLRVVVHRSTATAFHCEIAMLHGHAQTDHETAELPEPFAFRRRAYTTSESFDIALMIPTGVGCDVGGEAGDATPVARLLGGVCDRLILHPNVVNASDINEMPTNAIYVEGSILTRLLCGTVALRPVRSNRILVVAEETEDAFPTNIAVNAATGALATLGAEIVEVVRLESDLSMETIPAGSGRASGVLRGIDPVIELLRARRGKIDAVALTSTIATPGADTAQFLLDYFQAEGGVNPWGGVEALLTHAVSYLEGIPSAHAPMGGDVSEYSIDLGVVDPRKGAEAASQAYLFCALKGLHRSPRIVNLTSLDGGPPAGTLGIESIDALVIPAGSFGLAVAAAIDQGIPLVEVEDTGSIMRNDLTEIADGRTPIYRARSYAEAAGILVALREGMSLRSIGRPLQVPVTRVSARSSSVMTGNT